MSFDQGMGDPFQMFARVPGEEITARAAGEPLPEGVPVATEDAVIAALKTVHDPEIPGEHLRSGPDLRGRNSFGRVRAGRYVPDSAPPCPVAGEIPVWVANAVAAVEGVGEVEVNLIWDPPWTPDRMSDDAKLALDFE